MHQKLQQILLIDDNPASNLIHKKIISKQNCTRSISDFTHAEKALDYLSSIDIDEAQEVENPELIFLDINMPGMNGWEFIEEYDRINSDPKSIVIMLTTSINPDDESMARQYEAISGFLNKPLTSEKLSGVLEEYFGMTS